MYICCRVFAKPLVLAWARIPSTPCREYVGKERGMQREHCPWGVCCPSNRLPADLFFFPPWHGRKKQNTLYLCTLACKTIKQSKSDPYFCQRLYLHGIFATPPTRTLRSLVHTSPAPTRPTRLQYHRHRYKVKTVPPPLPPPFRPSPSAPPQPFAPDYPCANNSAWERCRRA